MDNNFIRTMEQVERALTEIDGEKDSFLANFETWRACRSNTLSALQKFVDEFHKISPNKIHLDNGAKVVMDAGIGVSALGFLATGVGYGLSYFSNWEPIGKELMKYGPVLGVGGGGVACFATLVKAGFSEQILSEVKAALEEDRRQTNELLPWFNRIQTMDVQLREVFDCGFTNIKNIVTAIREISVIVSRGGETLDNLLSYLTALISKNFSVDNLPSLDKKSLEVLCSASDKVKLFFREFCEDSEVRAAARGFCDSFRNYRLDSSHIAVISSLFIEKAGVGIEIFLSALPLAERERLQICANRESQTVLPSILCASNVFNLLASLEDLRNGVSTYCEIVRNTRTYLLEESNKLEESFSTLQKRDSYISYIS